MLYISCRLPASISIGGIHVLNYPQYILVFPSYSVDSAHNADHHLYTHEVYKQILMFLTFISTLSVLHNTLHIPLQTLSLSAAVNLYML